MELAGKVAIVTGAGGVGVGGLGVVYARALAEAGASVVVSDIDEGGAKAVAAALVADGHRAIGVKADVSREPEVEAMVAQAIQAFGTVDILVNNAGLARGKWSDGLALSAADWNRIWEVNTLSALLCARACRPAMSQRGGAIVNQASMAAYMEAGAYSVTKLALVGMTNILATELAGEGIRVNAIAPGMMSGKLPPEQVAGMLASQRMQRQGSAEDLVGTLLYLCSDRSSFVTGQTILVDGGAIRGRM